MDIVLELSNELNIDKKYVEAVISLLDEGCTVPFIARYRKDVTNSLEDVEIRKLEERLNYLRNLEARKKTILESIETQGKLTPQLKEKIENALVNSVLEDLYRPYKPKKKTRGSIAKEKGLTPLANFIKKDLTNTLDEEAKKYIDLEKGVKDEEEAIKGACDIIAEEISDNTSFRFFIKNLIAKEGFIASKQTKEPTSNLYLNYYNYKEMVSRARPHRILATSRGEKEKCLIRYIVVDEEKIFKHISKFVIDNRSPYKDMLLDVIKDSYKRLIEPSVTNDIFQELFTKAEDSSLLTFKLNLHELLMVAPLKNQVIMGFDPGYVNGCKIAVIDSKGDVLDTSIVYPTIKGKKGNQKDEEIVSSLIKKHKVTYIALGNGTASRESEDFLKKVLEKFKGVELVIVSEAGASIYSASELGIKEFPNYDVSLRSAVSIARRLLDPLSELVKIDPRSIGVGQYQHDLNQTKLKEALSGVVEDCVNSVGVDVNIASPSLLSYVSGISSSLANEIVNYRKENGLFKNRKEFRNVKKFGEKAFENAAGFLRIQNGEEPFDNSSIHPESYNLAKRFVSLIGLKDLKDKTLLNSLSEEEIESYAKKLDCGKETLKDIVKELIKPARDPREEVKKAKLNENIKTINDLKVGMVLEGTIRNIMDFGCFVDIGIHEDGLVHISELSQTYVKNVSDIVKINDIVKVKVIAIDLERKRISLSLKDVKEE